MSDVKRLLAEATPLPWHRDGRWFDNGSVDPHERDLIREPGNAGASVAAVHRFLHRPDINGDANADLIVYAVNRLPDYEAAVEALERLVTTVEMFFNGAEGDPAMIQAHAALARLRESVPA